MVKDNDTDIIVNTVNNKSSGKGNKEAYKNSPFVGKNMITCTDQELTVVWDNVLNVYKWPKIDLDSDEAVETRCAEYFEYCRTAGERPLVEGLAVAVGCNVRTLSDWELGKSRNGPTSRRSAIIKKAKSLIQYFLAQLAVGNKIYPNVWIFYGKNWFGMKDEQEVTITPGNQNEPQLSRDELLQIAEGNGSGQLEEGREIDF